MYETNRGAVLLRQQKIDDSNPGAVLLRQQKMDDSKFQVKERVPNPQGKRKGKHGMCHTMAWPFTLKSILRQKKKNYGNSNISPSKKYNLPKIL
jgi:hypothetical protein